MQSASFSPSKLEARKLTAMSVLSVRNLHVSFDHEMILEDLTFEVQAGEVIAVIGPNGAGKTTLFQALLGLIPYQGEIVWEEGVRKTLVPQRLEIARTFPIRVDELFRLAGDYSQSGSSLVRDVLKKVGSERLMSKVLPELSAGEFQRVLIAFALLFRPNVVLYDEPTAGVDIAGEVAIYELLGRLNKEEGVTLFLISHDLSVVSRLATRVICLNREVKCLGSPREIISPAVLKELYGQEISLYPHNHAKQ